MDKTAKTFPEAVSVQPGGEAPPPYSANDGFPTSATDPNLGQPGQYGQTQYGASYGQQVAPMPQLGQAMPPTAAGMPQVAPMPQFGQATAPTATGMPQEQVIWMARPEVVSLTCPPGLEYLAQLDQLFIKQIIELFEAFTGWETNNKFAIMNSFGQRVYFAIEETGLCMRQCCGNGRGFTMKIMDNSQQVVIQLTRQFKCCAGCCWCACSDCCAFEVVVEAPQGQVIGYVRQMQSGWKPKYTVMDSDRNIVFNIVGPCCQCQTICCTGDLDFNILSLDGTQQLGKISKKWAGIGKEFFLDADNFGVTFPLDLDVKMKATLIAATILIDFMYFEQQDN